MKWGVTCFFENRRDFAKVLEIAPQFPLSYLEIRGEQPFFAPEVLSEKELDFFRNIIDRSGLKVTLHSTFYDINLATINSFLRKATLECYRRYLDLAGELGAEIMVLHGGLLHRDAVDIPELLKTAQRNLVDNLRSLADYAAGKGVKIGLENSPPNRNHLMIPGWQQQVEILKATNRPNVGAVFDVAHAYLHRLDIETYYRKIEPYLIEIHAHNNDGSDDQHRAIGRGVIDYAALFGNHRVTVPVVLEIRNFAEAIESLEWIQKFG